MCSSGDALGNLFHLDDAECAVYGDARGNLFHVDDAECAALVTHLATCFMWIMMSVQL